MGGDAKDVTVAVMSRAVSAPHGARRALAEVREQLGTLGFERGRVDARWRRGPQKPGATLEAIGNAHDFTIFMLSPANLGGVRASHVLNPRASFPLAQRLHSSEGAPLGELFSFVSGLYFRGKMTYAQTFARAPCGVAGALVISPAEGMQPLDEKVTLDRLRRWAAESVDADNPGFTAPLLAHASELARACTPRTRFVLLGSVATDKYVRPLTQVFGERLLFPMDFVGRGDMSRGALLLRAAQNQSELAYAPVAGTTRRGPRAPGVAARRR